jgi:hypothetical protein
MVVFMLTNSTTGFFLLEISYLLHMVLDIGGAIRLDSIPSKCQYEICVLRKNTSVTHVMLAIILILLSKVAILRDE